MILTCPACDTKYVVKDDAIPPQGRQVRCASCKHSWHQDPELVLVEPADEGDVDVGGPPQPDVEAAEVPTGGLPAEVDPIDQVAGEPQPEVTDDEQSPWGTVSSESVESSMSLSEPADEVSMEEAPAVADEWRVPVAAETAEAAQPAEEEFVGYSPIVDDDQESKRRWPVILLILLLIAAAAAAFWFFAPPEWKQRAGIAQAGATPLQLMITTSDREALKSGNELLTISGRVINPTDEEQNVPPIQAELRDRQTQKVVHRWTIAPPARVLAPRSSATFYSAGVNVPEGGDELFVTLGS
jgi:predicted Zn finger-like uncharacterized protein